MQIVRQCGLLNGSKTECFFAFAVVRYSTAGAISPRPIKPATAATAAKAKATATATATATAMTEWGRRVDHSLERVGSLRKQ